MTAGEFKQLRLGLGMSQTQLARSLRVTQGAIAHWESGLRPVPGVVEVALMAVEAGMPTAADDDDGGDDATD